MFERHTEKARRAIFFARYEAGQYGSPYIETEHLLLGLMREDEALARFLRTHGFIESIRKAIEARITIRERISTSVEVPLSQECKRILNYAAEEAERLGDKHVGTEHFLLGILRDHQCFATCILYDHEVTPSRVRDELKPGWRKRAPTQARGWCCPHFQALCSQPDKREDCLRIAIITSNAEMDFLLENHRPDRTPSDIAADAIKLRFCPWCGRDLRDWYAFGLPPFQPSQQS